jgi:hypothetical protein
MENELVVNERTKWVGRYAVGIQIVGILVILFSGALGIWYAKTMLGRTQGLALVYAELSYLNAMGTGVAALALAQLLRYVFGERRNRGFLLRFADKGLILWAVLGLIMHCVEVLTKAPWGKVLALMVVSSLFPITRALLLISIALILRRALPIVEESRSLV